MLTDISIWIKVAILFFAILGIILFILGIRRIGHRKALTGSLEGLLGLLFVAVAALVIAISVNLYTYERLTHESVVVTIRLQSIGPQYFLAYVQIKDKTKILDLRGDEWVIEARVLKWRGMATLLGFNPFYRLDRFGGRYRDIVQERTALRTVHSLSDEKGLDLWTIARKHTRWIPWVDALYGSATYMPMLDGAQYTVSIGDTGLLSRPSNDIAQEAVEGWH